MKQMGLEMLTTKWPTLIVCGARSKWYRQKTQHIAVLSGHQDDCYKYSCDKCDSRFKLKKERTQHMREHIETYPCETCDAEFRWKTDRDKHMKELDHRKEKLTCDICKAQFTLFCSMRCVNTKEISFLAKAEH